MTALVLGHVVFVITSSLIRSSIDRVTPDRNVYDFSHPSGVNVSPLLGFLSAKESPAALGLPFSIDVLT